MTVSLLDDGIELRRALFLEFRTAAEDVRQAAADAETSLGRAVHEYRKALRRARALLRLLGDELPKGDRRDIRRALTDARRSLGAARDHAVANDVLAQVEGDREREIAKAILDTAASTAMTSRDIKQLMNEGAALSAAQVEMLDTALPPRIDWESLLSGVRETYRQARKDRKAAKQSRRAFHSWRRRCKELAIQLDILSRVAAPELDEVRREIVDATDNLGDAVDIFMARNFVRTHSEALDPDDVDLLLGGLEQQLDDKIRDCRQAARDAFHKKPRVLERKLAKLARRAVTPVAASPSIRGEEFATT
jgi:hypothetical protein